MGEYRQKGCPFQGLSPALPFSLGHCGSGGKGLLSRNEFTQQGRVMGGTRVECDNFQRSISGTSWI